MANALRYPARAGQQPALFVCALAWWSLLYCFTLTACQKKTSDEEQIRQSIQQLMAAAEAGKFGDMATFLHNDFRANNQMNAQQVRQMLAMAGMQQANLRITLISSKIEVDAVYTDKAISTLSVVATSGTGFAGLPADSSARRVTLEWRKDSDRWKILRARWNE